jgi:hypothetical protein
MEGTGLLPSAIAAATDEAIVGAIVQLGDDRLLAISRQLSRHAAVARSKRSSRTRKAWLGEEIVKLLSTAPGGIGRQELYRLLRCRAKDLDDTIVGLTYRRVVRVKEQQSRGRPARRYFLA